MKPAFEQMQAAIGARLTALAPTHWQLTDDSHHHIGHAGHRGGGHYRLLVVSDAFTGVHRLQRQRRVNQLLQDLFAADIHALSIRALCPQEYAQMANNHAAADGANTGIA